MKKHLFLIFSILMLSLGANAQIKIGNNPTDVREDASLEIEAVDETSVVFIADSTMVGIRVDTPTNVLHVKADADPIRLEGVQQSTNLDDKAMVITSEGVVKTAQINRLILLATFKKSTVNYLSVLSPGAESASIRGLHFDTVLLENLPSFDTSTGIFTAPVTGWYLVTTKLTTRPDPNVGGGGYLRLGVSRPNDVDFNSGNASFQLLEQRIASSNQANIPNVYISAGYMYLQKDDEIRAGTRYYRVDAQRINVEAINYNRYYVSQLSVEYIGE